MTTTISRTCYDDWEFIFQFLEPDKVTPIPITDWVFSLAIFQNNNIKVIEITSPDTNVSIDLPTAMVTFNVPRQYTNLNTGMPCTYFLQYINNIDKQKTPIANGTINLIAGRQL